MATTGAQTTPTSLTGAQEAALRKQVEKRLAPNFLEAKQEYEKKLKGVTDAEERARIEANHESELKSLRRLAEEMFKELVEKEMRLQQVGLDPTRSDAPITTLTSQHSLYEEIQRERKQSGGAAAQPPVDLPRTQPPVSRYPDTNVQPLPDVVEDDRNANMKPGRRSNPPSISRATMKTLYSPAAQPIITSHRNIVHSPPPFLVNDYEDPDDYVEAFSGPLPSNPSLSRRQSLNSVTSTMRSPPYRASPRPLPESPGPSRTATYPHPSSPAIPSPRRNSGASVYKSGISSTAPQRGTPPGAQWGDGASPPRWSEREAGGSASPISPVGKSGREQGDYQWGSSPRSRVEYQEGQRIPGVRHPSFGSDTGVRRSDSRISPRNISTSPATPPESYRPQQPTTFTSGVTRRTESEERGVPIPDRDRTRAATYASPETYRAPANNYGSYRPIQPRVSPTTNRAAFPPSSPVHVKRQNSTGSVRSNRSTHSQSKSRPDMYSNSGYGYHGYPSPPFPDVPPSPAESYADVFDEEDADFNNESLWQMREKAIIEEEKARKREEWMTALRRRGVPTEEGSDCDLEDLDILRGPETRIKTAEELRREEELKAEARRREEEINAKERALRMMEQDILEREADLARREQLSKLEEELLAKEKSLREREAAIRQAEQEAERKRKEQAEEERIRREEETERKRKEQAEEERIRHEEKLRQEAERERLRKEEEERLQQEAEMARLKEEEERERVRLEEERIRREAEEAEQERLRQEAEERERVRKETEEERERIRKEEEKQERLRKEEAKREQVRKEQQEKERLRKEKEEKERQKKELRKQRKLEEKRAKQEQEERMRKEREQELERIRKEKEEEERENERREKEREKEREELERAEKEKTEKEKVEWEKREREAREKEVREAIEREAREREREAREKEEREAREKEEKEAGEIAEAMEQEARENELKKAEQERLDKLMAEELARTASNEQVAEPDSNWTHQEEAVFSKIEEDDKLKRAKQEEEDRLLAEKMQMEEEWAQAALLKTKQGLEASRREQVTNTHEYMRWQNDIPRKRQDSTGTTSDPRRSPITTSTSSSSQTATPWNIPNRSSSTQYASPDRTSSGSSFSNTSGASFWSQNTGASGTSYSSTASANFPSAGFAASPKPPTTPVWGRTSHPSTAHTATPHNPSAHTSSTAHPSSAAHTSSTAYPTSTPYTASSPQSPHPPHSATTGFAHANEQSSYFDHERWQSAQDAEAARQAERFVQEQKRAEMARQARESRGLPKDDIIKLFEEHNRRWKDIIPQTDTLGWASVPWPTLRLSHGPEDLTPAAINAYIRSEHYWPGGKTLRDRVKDQLRRWHPDRFNINVLRKTREADRERVKLGSGIVVRTLNDILVTIPS